MGLSLTDLRASGLLELYVIGELSPREHAQVEEAIQSYPELKQELQDIEQTLQQLAFAKTIPPNSRVLTHTLAAIPGVKINPIALPAAPRNWAALGLLLLSFALLSSAVYFWNLNKQTSAQLASVQAERNDCLAQQEATKAPIAMLEDLQRSDNQIVKIGASDKYPSANVYLYLNNNTKRNYLTLSEMPALAADQSYQLWSLKANVDPIPLNVFDDAETIIPVAFEEGSANYAITIEQKGGATAPNLEELIGVFSVSG